MNLTRALLLATAAIPAFASAALVYDAGHGDIEFNYVDEGAGLEFEGAIHSDQHGHTDSDGQLIRMDTEHITLGGTGGTLLGTTSSYWRIWQDSSEAPPGAVDLGWSAEETLVGTVDNNWIFATLTGFSGPGNVVVWRDGFTTPVVSTVDGVSSADVIRLTAGAHFHRNFAFSNEGTYELTFKPHAFIGGNRIDGDEFTYSFQAVPEPGTMAALGLGALSLLRRRKAR